MSFNKITFEQGEVNLPANIEINAFVTNELRLIFLALNHCDWNRTRAARSLGVSYRTFVYRCQKYGISHPFWNRNGKK